MSKRLKKPDSISLKGVYTHNLKGIDVDIPIGKLTTVCGVSGSGKSSLVFDTLYAESYRRYLESLSSFARQYMQQLPKPKIDSIHNLPPSIAVRQSRSKATSRSTVGTMTELLDLIRTLYIHQSKVQCFTCDIPVKKYQASDIWNALQASEEPFYNSLRRSSAVMVAARNAGWKNLKATDLKAYLVEQGFSRAWVKGALMRIEDCKATALKAAYVVVDRLKNQPSSKSRFMEGVELAYKLGAGRLVLIPVDQDGKSKDEFLFTQKLECSKCEEVYPKPSLSLFSYNHPQGACDVCQGFGMESKVDMRKVIPDRKKTLREKAVALFNFGDQARFTKYLITEAKKQKVSMDKSIEDFSEKEMEWLTQGTKSFLGVDGFMEWLRRKRYKTHYRVHIARYQMYVLCGECKGSRLQNRSLAYKLGKRSIADLCQDSIDTLSEEVKRLKLVYEEKSKAENSALSEAYAEIDTRLEYLLEMGLGYLHLNRASRTLSGGEYQRIYMARSLANQLTETLYCLDEPSSGLHPRDSQRLLKILKALRAQGNTVVVVEHEKVLIEGSDEILEIGPKAGKDGGEVIYQGSATKRAERQKIVFSGGQEEPEHFFEVKGVTTHNLKEIDLKIPIRRVTGICGVSGSGKSSAIVHTVVPAIANALGIKEFATSTALEKANFKSMSPPKLDRFFQDIMVLSQGAVGRSTRSNIATYLGIYDEVRKTMAKQPASKRLGLKPGAFSFNVSGGRCENCKGLGVVEEEMSFLGDLKVKCPECNGKRFSEDVLGVEFKGKNILQILALTVEEAAHFFFDQANVHAVLANVVQLGMGYLSLGQNTSSFSGGEAQRLKILQILLGGKKSDRPSLVVLDEPSTGLSDSDVALLLRQIRTLAARGHTVVVIEHHGGVLAACDHMIELGPDAGPDGGKIIFEGKPEEVLKSKKSLFSEFFH